MVGCATWSAASRSPSQSLPTSQGNPAMSSVGTARSAAVPPPARQARRNPVSHARAAASRKNGARSRGPKSPKGKARAAPESRSSTACGRRSTCCCRRKMPRSSRRSRGAIVAELAPEGIMQTVLARRVAVAAWRLERADRMEAEVLEFRSYEDANAGLALIRDGNATRSFRDAPCATAAPPWPSSGARCAPSRRSRPSRRRRSRRAPILCGRRPRADRPREFLSRRVEPNEPNDGRMRDPRPGSTMSCPIRPGLVPRCTNRRHAGCRTNPKPTGTTASGQFLGDDSKGRTAAEVS